MAATIKCRKNDTEETIPAGDLDPATIESTSPTTSKAKRYSDKEYWNFSISAEDLRGWHSIEHKNNLEHFGRVLLGKDKKS